MTPDIQQARNDLVSVLHEAAELEHALCCMYLFAAFSLKRSVDDDVSWEQLNRLQEWAGDLLLIARQEMEHLGIIFNLLASIGAPPWILRPNFPCKGHSYGELGELALKRFSAETLDLLLAFEQPEAIHLRRALLRAIDRAGPDFQARLRGLVERICQEAHWDYGEAWMREGTFTPVCACLCHLDRHGPPEARKQFRQHLSNLVDAVQTAAVAEPAAGEAADPGLRQRLLEPPDAALWGPPARSPDGSAPGNGAVATPPTQELGLRSELFDLRTSFPLTADGKVVAVLVFYHRSYDVASNDSIGAVVQSALNNRDETLQTTVGAALIRETTGTTLQAIPVLTRPVPSDLGFSTLGGFYRQIRRMLQELAREAADCGASLFKSAEDGQVGQKDIGLSFPDWFDIQLDKVHNISDALKVVDLIIAQGEGRQSEQDPGAVDDSHYGRLLRMRRDLQNERGLEPARDVVSNPSVAPSGAARAGTTPLTHPYTKQVAMLFNDVYRTMLMTLTEFYVRLHSGGKTPADLTKDRDLITHILRTFMPSMSMFIRPLGEMLTQMPASDEADSPKAGACFELAQDVDEHQGLDALVAGWRLLAERTAAIAANPAAPARLGTIAQNMKRLAGNLARAVESASQAGQKASPIPD